MLLLTVSLSQHQSSLEVETSRRTGARTAKPASAAQGRIHAARTANSRHGRRRAKLVSDRDVGRAGSVRGRGVGARLRRVGGGVRRVGRGGRGGGANRVSGLALGLGEEGAEDGGVDLARALRSVSYCVFDVSEMCALMIYMCEVFADIPWSEGGSSRRGR